MIAEKRKIFFLSYSSTEGMKGHALVCHYALLSIGNPSQCLCNKGVSFLSFPFLSFPFLSFPSFPFFPFLSFLSLAQLVQAHNPMAGNESKTTKC